MQLKSQELQRLVSLSKEFLDANENLIDIIVIGSSVRGKLKPGDVDAVLLTRRTDLEISKKFVQHVSAHKLELNLHPIEFLVDRFFSGAEPLVTNILHEGYSVKNGAHFGDVIHFRPFTLFTYSISKFDKNKKQKFFYALKGRGSEGVLKNVGGLSVAPSVALVPVEHEDEFDAFLTSWTAQFEKRRIFYEL